MKPTDIEELKSLLVAKSSNWDMFYDLNIADCLFSISRALNRIADKLEDMNDLARTKEGTLDE
jgi:hypothetical protein